MTILAVLGITVAVMTPWTALAMWLLKRAERLDGTPVTRPCPLRALPALADVQAAFAEYDAIQWRLRLVMGDV